MALQSGFFNSIDGDRAKDAGFFGRYFASFIGNGVFPNPSNNFQVFANNDMTITIRKGNAWINGVYCYDDFDYTASLDIADGVLNRIDRVVLRLDVIDREIKLLVKKGTFASSPVAPTLQRDSDAYELGIADIRVNKGVTRITQANITDTRYNKSLCGIVHGVVDQVDTTTLFNQYQSWYSQSTGQAELDIDTMLDHFMNDFNIWFSTVQDVLDGDVAGNLFNMITQAQNDLSSHLADYRQHVKDVFGGDSIIIENAKLSGNYVNFSKYGIIFKPKRAFNLKSIMLDSLAGTTITVQLSEWYEDTSKVIEDDDYILKKELSLDAGEHRYNLDFNIPDDGKTYFLWIPTPLSTSFNRPETFTRPENPYVDFITGGRAIPSGSSNYRQLISNWYYMYNWEILSSVRRIQVVDDTTGDKYKWGIDNGLVYLEKVGG